MTAQREEISASDIERPPEGAAVALPAAATETSCRRPGRPVSADAAMKLQRTAGNRAVGQLVRGAAPQVAVQRVPDVIEVELLTEYDTYTAPRSGTSVRVGDAHGPVVLMNIVESGAGSVRLHYFNFRTGRAHVGSVTDWDFLSLIDIGGTADSQRFGRLGRSLTPAQWRRLWPNPVPELLRLYEQGSSVVTDEMITSTYRGMVRTASVERLNANETTIDALLKDEGRVARLEEYAQGLLEASTIRDKLVARKAEVDRQLSLSQQGFQIGLPKRQTMAGLDMAQRIVKLKEQAELQEAIDFWLLGFPLLTRLQTTDINAGRIERVLREIKTNIVETRVKLADGKIDEFELEAVRPSVDPKLGTRAKAAIAAEDTSRSRWAWFKAGAMLAVGIGLLFVPGGIFIDAAIGAALGASAIADAIAAGKLANTGLHVDDGLMTQAQASSARFNAILGTIGAIVGTAFAGLRVLRVGRAFSAIGKAMPELEFAARARLARLLADEPELAGKLLPLAQREAHVLPALREAMTEFSGDTFRLRQAIQAIADGYRGPARQAWMHGLHADALAAIQKATPAELEELQALMRGRSRTDAEELLRQFTYKGRKAERKGGAAFEGVPDAVGKLKSGLAELAEVRKRGYPHGFASKEAYKTFGDAVRDAARRYGVDVSDVRVQGSALHNRTPGDIDVGLFVDAGKFDALARQFADAATSAGNTKLAKTILKEAADGKIPHLRFAPREAGFDFMGAVRGAAGNQKVQVSLIKRGSEFDLGPFLPAP